jgi:glycosyltransferase involved in cell wall biosynthesis
MQLCVVIPAYNEAATIRDVAVRALAQCKHVIVVDDGSSDGTAQALAALPLTLLRHESNRGKAAALWSGFERALADGAAGVITLDGDGQHRPEDIPRFIEAARSHRDCIVIGSRIVERAAFPKARYYANCTANFWISWAAGYRIEDSQSGFRLYPAKLVQRVRVPHDRAHGFVFESEILIEAARAGIRSLALPIAAIYAPGARASHFRAVVDVLRITRMVAWKLLSRALYPQGFVRAFLWPRAPGDCADASAVEDAAVAYPTHPKKLAGGGKQ